MPNEVPDRIRFGPYEVDLHTHELWKHGLRLRLVGQPFEILSLLLTRPGELVTREELRAQLWPGDTFVDFNHGLNAAVNKLREALSDSADEPRYIETLPRRGYRFIAAVERAARADKAEIKTATSQGAVLTMRSPDGEPVAATQRPPAAQGPAFSQSPIPSRVVPASRRRSIWPGVAISVFLLGVLLVAWFAAGLRHQTAENREASVRANTPATPILPLTNLPDLTSEPAFSPDGNRVAFRREGYAPGTSGIFVKPLGSVQLLQLTNNPTDSCPVWSPTGRFIAFSRFSDKDRTIYEVPSTGGVPRELYRSQGSKRGDLDWSPDGNSIVFSDKSDAGTESIFLLSMKDLSVRRISQPPLLNRDWGPVFSPDGQDLAFVRTRETGLPETIVVMPAGGGEVRVLVTWNNGIVGPPAWAADGQSILFSTGEPSLLRVPVSGGAVTEVSEAGAPAWRPAVSRRGYRLAYQKISKAVSVLQMDMSQTAKPSASGVVVTDTGRNEGAQVSPDGKKVAFMSDRSGRMDIWVGDRDGANPNQLTAMGTSGTPRWSPDCRSIAFDRDTAENDGIFVVDVDRGSPRSLVQGGSQNLVPSWSRDGKWIYFASNRSGMWQVWKVAAGGGTPVQVTAHGGFAAYESRDGRVLYYSKFNMPSPEVWKLPLGGGMETLVSPLVRPDDWANWALVDRGIYFVEKDTTGTPFLMFFDFSSGQVKRITTFDKMPFWLSATPDGKSVLYEHLDQENSHVMLLENFH